MLIYDHTLIFISLKLHFVYSQIQINLPKISICKIAFGKSCFGLVWLTARSTAGRAELHCRSPWVGRPTCTIVHVCTSVDREQLQCSLFFPGWRDWSTDRETYSLVGTAVGRPDRPGSQRSEIRPLMVDRPDRPASVRKFWQTPTAIFLKLVFYWVSPQRLFWPL